MGSEEIRPTVCLPPVPPITPPAGEAGVSRGCHTVRHSAPLCIVCDQPAEDGQPVVARLFGHSDARMLQKTYFREDTDAMVEAMKKATGA